MQYGIGTGGKKLILALSPGEEMMGSILKAYDEAGFENAIITCCMGSLKKISYAYPITDDSKPHGFRYCDTITLDGLIELVSAQGTICRIEQGEIFCHLHAVFADDDSIVKAGHIVDQGNIVLGALEVHLEEVKGINMKRKMHEIFKAPILNFD